MYTILSTRKRVDIVRQISPLLKKDTSSGFLVYQTLKARILHWEYLPGERLTEEELCSEFGVSRSPVREALRMLIESGLVQKEPNRGHKVTELDLQYLNELYEVRVALETYAVGRAAAAMPAETWERLYAFWSQPPADIPPAGLDLTPEDELFHETIAAASGNQTLLQYLRSINERLRFIRMHDFTSHARILTTFAQHLRILELIRDHQTEAAQEAVRANIEMSHQSTASAATEAIGRAYLRRKQTAR